VHVKYHQFTCFIFRPPWLPRFSLCCGLCLCASV